jgi:hypothetical protein
MRSASIRLADEEQYRSKRYTGLLSAPGGFSVRDDELI